MFGKMYIARKVSKQLHHVVTTLFHCCTLTAEIGQQMVVATTADVKLQHCDNVVFQRCAIVVH